MEVKKTYTREQIKILNLLAKECPAIPFASATLAAAE